MESFFRSSRHRMISAKRFATIVILYVFVAPCLGQSKTPGSPDNSRPEVGKPIPEFVFHDVRYCKFSHVTNNTFLGKWLILDFWFSGCVTCIKSMPKTNDLQTRFGEQVQFLLVGVNETRYSYGRGIEVLYEKLRTKQNLQLAIAYDSITKMKWDIWEMPHLIIVDPEGIVRAVTTGLDLNEDKLRALIEGRVTRLAPKGEDLIPFDPLNVNQNSLFYRSLLTKWQAEKQYTPTVRDNITYAKTPGMRTSRVPLYALYNLAFIGDWGWMRRDSLYSEYYPLPVLELEDSTQFTYDFATGLGLYNYDLLIPPSRKTLYNVMENMQADLKHAFGYDVSIEQRWMPVWDLVATDQARLALRTKGGKSYFSDRGGSGGAGGFVLINGTIEILMDLVTRYTATNADVYFNLTGIDYNIDIEMDCLMSDAQQVSQTLRRNGLDLVRSKRLMKVVAIRDGAARSGH